MHVSAWRPQLAVSSVEKDRQSTERPPPPLHPKKEAHLSRGCRRMSSIYIYLELIYLLLPSLPYPFNSIHQSSPNTFLFMQNHATVFTPLKSNSTVTIPCLSRLVTLPFQVFQNQDYASHKVSVVC